MPQQKPKKSPSGLELLGPTTWPAIYREWWRQEGRRTDWRRHLRQRGFSSWRAWREAVIIKPFQLQQQRWQVFRVTDPTMVIDWHGGPFPGWKKSYYAGAQTRSFRWLVADGKIKKNRKVKAFKKIPRTMKFFGLRYHGRIIIIDGMHRCCALALMIARKKPVRTAITLALAETTKLPKLKARMV